jgi:hypothetical protein
MKGDEFSSGGGMQDGMEKGSSKQCSTSCTNGKCVKKCTICKDGQCKTTTEQAGSSGSSDDSSSMGGMHNFMGEGSSKNCSTSCSNGKCVKKCTVCTNGKCQTTEAQDGSENQTGFSDHSDSMSINSNASNRGDVENYSNKGKSTQCSTSCANGKCVKKCTVCDNGNCKTSEEKVSSSEESSSSNQSSSSDTDNSGGMQHSTGNGKTQKCSTSCTNGKCVKKCTVCDNGICETTIEETGSSAGSMPLSNVRDSHSFNEERNNKETPRSRGNVSTSDSFIDSKKLEMPQGENGTNSSYSYYTKECEVKCSNDNCTKECKVCDGGSCTNTKSNVFDKEEKADSITFFKRDGNISNSCNTSCKDGTCSKTCKECEGEKCQEKVEKLSSSEFESSFKFFTKDSWEKQPNRDKNANNSYSNSNTENMSNQQNQSSTDLSEKPYNMIDNTSKNNSSSFEHVDDKSGQNATTLSSPTNAKLGEPSGGETTSTTGNTNKGQGPSSTSQNPANLKSEALSYNEATSATANTNIDKELGLTTIMPSPSNGKLGEPFDNNLTSTTMAMDNGPSTTTGNYKPTEQFNNSQVIMSNSPNITKSENFSQFSNSDIPSTTAFITEKEKVPDSTNMPSPTSGKLGEPSNTDASTTAILDNGHGTTNVFSSTNSMYKEDGSLTTNIPTPTNKNMGEPFSGNSDATSTSVTLVNGLEAPTTTSIIPKKEKLGGPSDNDMTTTTAKSDIGSNGKGY